MATIESIASRRQLAVESLAASMKAIGVALNIEPAEVLVQGYQDPNFTQAVQLEIIAAYLVNVSEALTNALTRMVPEAKDYETFTDPALWEVVAKRRIATSDVSRDELIDVLRAYDAQQAVKANAATADAPVEDTGKRARK